MRLSLVVLFSFFISVAFGQNLSNLRTKTISIAPDSIQIDSFSIAPGTFRMIVLGQSVDTSAYTFDFINSILRWNKNSESYKKLSTDSVVIKYRAFSFLFSKEISHKNKAIISTNSQLPFYYTAKSREPELFKLSGLTRSGSISRGVTFGNNQDVFVNSSLNLQLSGKLNEDVEILAAITDENIPIQPEGNTQQLQDFDKVFIQISNAKNKLIAGDFELKKPTGYFMNYYKKGQGAAFSSIIDIDTTKNQLVKIGGGLAVSKGKLARNTIATSEGNQGPYRLIGSNGETFIIILAGTEKIYLDGQLLQRGLQNDYTIDYNTAELTFTTKRIITKDSRVVIEFEYSDKNYARSLITFNSDYESRKLKLHLNIYSEQDSKNQALNIELDSAKKSLLASVGDSIQNAFYPTADSVEFNSSVVLYQKIDTITGSGTYSIFKYSTSADSAYWQVNFSEVGNFRGNYIQTSNSANGRVFKWVEPVNGIPQGNYAPVALLVTPKKQQMVTAGGEIILNSKNSVLFEGALSNYDVNLFSTLDKKNDAGYAAKIIYKNLIQLSQDTLKGWRLNSALNYEYTSKNFKPIDRYRNVEFERDWNLGTSSIYNDENIGSLQTTLSKPEALSVTYQIKTYLKGSAYNGLMHSESTKATWKKFDLISDASLLNTTGLLTKTNFIRHTTELSRPVWKLRLGVRESGERNRFLLKNSDTLSASSYSFNEIQAFLNTLDSTKAKATLVAKQRTDQLPVGEGFRNSTLAQELSLTTDFSTNQKHTVRTTTTYRKLSSADSALVQIEPTKTLLNRIDHFVSLFKGVLTATTYYEVGTGQERKQDYYYLEVPAGQGVYAYLEDYNGNGVKDLDEFAPAAFQSDAKFIRVFVPTNEYVITRSNRFSEVLTITPSGKSSSFQGKEKFIFRFTDQLSVSFDKKTKDETLLSSLNPFSLKLTDTSLIANNSSFRNTIYYNRNSPVYGFDFTIQEIRNKALLSNGFESRLNRNRIFNIRWNLNREFLLSNNYENGEKVNTSDFFSTRDYHIFSNAFEPKLSFQQGNSLRLSFSYRYSEKRNTIGEEKERAFLNKLNLESKYTTVNSGTITGKISYVKVKFNALQSSLLAYEMLEGFKPGENFIWNLSVQRNISSYMQLSLNYEGRKLQDSETVHTGGVQFRAFF
ncbi:MAG: hypothetical protein IPL24_09965 [Bacteroidetes bacterium]|nr:hypothetical protein [Bacteroidota bacterium]